MECFICLNELDISQNNFHLKCCNNFIHHNCIKSWLNHNKKLYNNKCPYCTKINHDFGSLIYQDIDIIIIDNNYININTENIENIENNNYSFLCYFTIIVVIIFIGLFFPF